MPTPDQFYLQQALTFAQHRRGFCAPNPAVGAIITDHKKILASGFHFAAGHPHAEIEALKNLTETKNTTVYVTLEPCCHHGKTPPCTDALIKAKVKRVVYAYRDPNPLVAGKGEQQLKAAGIQCEHISLPEIDAFYKSYQYWHKTKRPFVTAKIAITLDGKVAGKNYQPVKITGDEINQLTHQYRKTSDAILTTAKTIICDDSKLNVRLQKETIAKPLYIIDTHLRLPTTAQIFQTAKSITVFHDKNAPLNQQLALNSAGARCVAINTADFVENRTKWGNFDINQVIEFIGNDGIHDVWVEAGAQFFNSLHQQNLVQKTLIYIAPWVMGEGIPLAKIEFRNTNLDWKKFGQDVLCEINW